MTKTYTIENVIRSHDFDKLVEETYGIPYDFQQQDGCKSRELVCVCVDDDEEYWTNTSIPIEPGGCVRGLSFSAWVNHDKLAMKEELTENRLLSFYHRNFYPDVNMILRDLIKKGLLEDKDLWINIDW